MDAITKPAIIPRERLDLVEKLYLTGVPEHRIQRRICDEYGVSTRTARRYLERVRAKLADRPVTPPETVRARAEAMLLEAYETARDKRDRTGAAMPDCGSMVAASYRLAELHGAAAPKRLDVTSGGEALTKLPDAELLTRIAALESASG